MLVNTELHSTAAELNHLNTWSFLFFKGRVGTESVLLFLTFREEGS